MIETLAKLPQYFQYPFVRYALVAGTLIAFCSSLLGVTLVLRRFSFIGDGLSHVAFGAMAVSAVVGLTNDMPLTLVITVVCAILLLRTGQNTKINGDATVAMISVGALAVGYLLMNLFAKSARRFSVQPPFSRSLCLRSFCALFSQPLWLLRSFCSTTEYSQ